MEETRVDATIHVAYTCPITVLTLTPMETPMQAELESV